MFWQCFNVIVGVAEKHAVNLTVTVDTNTGPTYIAVALYQLPTLPSL